MFSGTHGDDDAGRLCPGLEAIDDLTHEFIPRASARMENRVHSTTTTIV